MKSKNKTKTKDRLNHEDTKGTKKGKRPDRF
jgi:hypothetical protein